MSNNVEMCLSNLEQALQSVQSVLMNIQSLKQISKHNQQLTVHLEDVLSQFHTCVEMAEAMEKSKAGIENILFAGNTEGPAEDTYNIVHSFEEVQNICNLAKEQKCSVELAGINMKQFVLYTHNKLPEVSNNYADFIKRNVSDHQYFDIMEVQTPDDWEGLEEFDTHFQDEGSRVFAGLVLPCLEDSIDNLQLHVPAVTNIGVKKITILDNKRAVLANQRFTVVCEIFMYIGAIDHAEFTCPPKRFTVTYINGRLSTHKLM